MEQGEEFVYGSAPAAQSCTASDTVSGPASCVVTGYSAEVGSHTLTATARDVSGNTVQLTRDYVVRPWRLDGFYSPVDLGGVLNTVKNGATVPLKFEVFAGGAELTETTAVTGLSATRIACHGAAHR